MRTIREELTSLAAQVLPLQTRLILLSAADKIDDLEKTVELLRESAQALTCAKAEQPETLSPWMPIESAPKDGSNFYVTGFNYGNASNGRWHDVGHVTPRGGIKSTLTWLNLDFATHWMPLPQPPEVK